MLWHRVWDWQGKEQGQEDTVILWSHSGNKGFYNQKINILVDDHPDLQGQAKWYGVHFFRNLQNSIFVINALTLRAFCILSGVPFLIKPKCSPPLLNWNQVLKQNSLYSQQTIIHDGLYATLHHYSISLLNTFLDIGFCCLLILPEGWYNIFHVVGAQ